MKRILIGLYHFVVGVTKVTIRTGNLIALVLAACIFVQIQSNILVMEDVVSKALHEATCAARRLDFVDRAQSYAADCAEITKLEVHRTRTLEIELETWVAEYDDLSNEHLDQQLVNRSMRNYIVHLHQTLLDNGLKIPPRQTEPIK